MQPLGLAFKDYEVNLFTGRGNGELMLIHRCLGCGKFSPNRIAGDDNEHKILSLLQESIKLDKETMNQLTRLGLNVITTKNKEEVMISLFGVNYQNCLKNY